MLTRGWESPDGVSEAFDPDDVGLESSTSTTNLFITRDSQGRHSPTVTQLRSRWQPCLFPAGPPRATKIWPGPFQVEGHIDASQGENNHVDCNNRTAFTAWGGSSPPRRTRHGSGCSCEGMCCLGPGCHLRKVQQVPCSRSHSNHMKNISDVVISFVSLHCILSHGLLADWHRCCLRLAACGCWRDVR